MTTKEYLMQIKNIDKKIESLNRSIEECQEKATNITQSYSDIPPQHNGGVSQKIASNAEKKIDFESEAKRLKAESEQLKIKIGLEISNVKNNIYNALLWDYYVNNLSWEIVAENLGKDVDYTRKELHRFALLSFEKENFKNPENPLKHPCFPQQKVV